MMMIIKVINICWNNFFFLEENVSERSTYNNFIILNFHRNGLQEASGCDLLFYLHISDRQLFSVKLFPIFRIKVYLCLIIPLKFFICSLHWERFDNRFQSSVSTNKSTYYIYMYN